MIFSRPYGGSFGSIKKKSICDNFVSALGISAGFRRFNALTSNPSRNADDTGTNLNKACACKI